jgi:hypothetical protein
MTSWISEHFWAFDRVRRGMATQLGRKTEEFLLNTCIFCQPWWLQAVAPDHWDVAIATRGDEIAAVWPYAYKMRLARFRLIEIPDLTFYLGPWLRSSTAKNSRRLAEQKDLIGELVEALPPFGTFHQWLHPSVTNWLPLYWKGFTQTTRYTYRFSDTRNIDGVWEQVNENIRTDIRKAQKHLQVVEDPDVGRFLKLLHATFARQRLPLPLSEENLRRLESECSKRKSRKILCAEDSSGRAHAATYVVYDQNTVYSLLRARDPELGGSGATSLVVWKQSNSLRRKRKCSTSWVPGSNRSKDSFAVSEVNRLPSLKSRRPTPVSFAATERCIDGYNG